MSRQVKVGIIGLGFMGTTHLDIYRHSEKARVTAVADVDPAKRRGDISAVVGNIGGSDNSRPLDMTGITAYEDGLALIRDPEVELVDICVPVYLHKDYALAAIAAGKPLLCEKPLARHSGDASEIAQAARKAGAKCMVGMCLRYWPEYAHALEVVRSGKAGAVKTATFRRVSPDIRGNGWQDWFMKSELSGGAILDLHLHDVDFIRQLIGMPRSVTAFGARGVRSDRGVDHVVACYDFGNSALVSAEGGWTPAKGTPFEMSFLIVCERMTLRLAADGYAIIHEDGTVEKPVTARPGFPTGWHIEIDHMLDCVLNSTQPAMDLEEVVEAIRIVEAETRSIEERKPITI